jgi:lipopolysaccharide transport system ATP-binding protein
MPLPAISVRNLGKMYRLSHQGKRTDSFREAITSALASPWRRLRQLRGTDETMEEFWALKDVSFDVQPGEVVGIIGHNGAGKSTLLKILSRIVEPTTGEIRLRGRVASLLEVGTGFHPELTGRENIYLNGSILGMKKREIDRKFDEIVDFAEVEKFLDTPVKRYSSGMYVRLAFAVAAHLDPEILIVDEVLAVGDAEFQKKCLGKMKQISTGTGRTVLFVSHNMSAILQLCSKAVLLKSGSIDLYGPAKLVSNRYFHNAAASQDRTCDLSKLPRPMSLTHAAQLKSCSLGTDDKSPPWTTQFGDPVSISIVVAVEKPIAFLELGMAISKLGGSEFASSLSTDSYQTGSLSPGIYTFEVSFPDLMLLPGQYILGFGIRSERGFEDYVPEAAILDVMMNEKSAILRADTRMGAVVPKACVGLSRNACTSESKSFQSLEDSL